MARTATPTQHLDLRPALGDDEASFAARFYREDWQAGAYQTDRLRMSREVLFPLTLPNGHVLMLGTHNTRIFDAWCSHWGYRRCTGFDLINDTGHPRVEEVDVRHLGPGDDMDVALAWNDIGSWKRTPEARRASYDWLKRQILPGGYLLERGDAVAGWPLGKDLKISGSDAVRDIWGGAYRLFRRRD